MLITSLEKMESIVRKNNRLSWDGWDVLLSLPNPSAWRYRDGAYVNSRWCVQKRYKITERGWDVPERLIRRNG